MPEKPTIVCGVLNGVIGCLKRQNVETDQILTSISLTHADIADNDAFILFVTFARFLEEAAQVTQNEHLTLSIGREFDAKWIGPVGYALLHAATIRDSLNTQCKYWNLTNCLRRGEIIERGRTSQFSWSYTKNIPGLRQYLAWTPAIIVNRARLALGKNWMPPLLELECAKPERLEPFQEMFGSSIRFNQPCNSIHFRRHELAAEMPCAHPRLWEHWVNLATAIGEDNPEITDIAKIVQIHIANNLSNDAATIEIIAKKLGKSPRNLQRDLKEAGTSFSGLLDKTRSELAEEYLLSSNLKLSQIAYNLGFSELSSFTRAASRWFGEPPRARRRRLRADAEPHREIREIIVC